MVEWEERLSKINLSAFSQNNTEYIYNISKKNKRDFEFFQNWNVSLSVRSTGALM